ncbi:MAG: primosomal protein N' [Bryobacteraceae bacterium]|nr:primosomal protein N' [Bryobacteraceae bacterium]
MIVELSQPDLPRFADLSLPVPVDHQFTYGLPETLRHRAQTGCRAVVPFGSRQLTGVILRVHDAAPPQKLRDVTKLIDERPVLDEHLIALGRWIAEYYCAPLGEVLRGMAPLAGEVGKRRTYSLTDKGRDVARQLTLGAKAGEDAAVDLLRLLEARALAEATLAQKVPKAAYHLRALAKRGLVSVEDDAAKRDPLRSPSDRLEAEFLARTEDKLPKKERELLAYLELHPGTHRLDKLEETIAGASQAARALARKSLASVSPVATEPAGTFASAPHLLNSAQQTALDAISKAIGEKQFAAFLLHGVTGSGKTEVYLRAIDRVLAEGRSALLLVPEIALTPQVAGQFFGRFGSRAAILHSAFNDTERAAQWRRIHAGEVTVAVGTRSAVFAPLKNLGLILVDEEHDGSYKQEETPRYSGRDVAVMRARMLDCTVVLGSATPSLESRHNAERGRYRYLELPDRVERRAMPDVELIDMRQEFLETRAARTFSRRLLDALRDRLANREQAMLLLNRRGFSTFVACRACGERIMCANCAVTLTYHRRDQRLLCHFCGYAEGVPQTCPACRSDHLYFSGTGSERVEDELHREFPEARIARMDRDTVGGKDQYESILSKFRAREYDILVGTQMIAKGHDIPNVTLVGAVNADIGLGLPDFRAAERTFQLLTQAAGRAGRGYLAGQVLIQTVNPDHYAVRFAAAQDYRLFYEKEIQFRRVMRYPPFAALASLVVRSEDQDRARSWIGDLAQRLNPPPEGMVRLGPNEAAVPRVKREFRFQMLLKSASRAALARVLRELREYTVKAKWPATALAIDVDPMTLL